MHVERHHRLTSEQTSKGPAASHRRRALPVGGGFLPLDRPHLTTDVIAGTTLAALGIPEVMGYAKIAGMPVITGLYTILIPIAVFALLGSSRHLVVGADSATAAILAAGLAGLAAAGSSQYVALAGMVALVTGAMLVVARIVRLGLIADFLSRSVLIGFLTGVGVQVAMGQVAGMLDVPAGTGGTLEKFWTAVTEIGEANGPTVVVSAAVLVVILGAKRIDKRIPGALIAVVGSIVVSWKLDLAADDVSTLGKVPSGLPHFGLPGVGLSDLPALAATVGAILLVILAQSAATSRAYAARYSEEFDENVDLVGLGAANVAAGFSGTFVVNGSPTKTQMVDSAGGRSQVSQLTTAAVVLVVLLFLTVPLQYLPNAVLSSVVFLIGVELIDVAGMKGILRARRDEFAIASLTALVVVVVGVQQGVLLAIVLSMLDYVRRGYRPSRTVLSPGGPGTDGGYRGHELPSPDAVSAPADLLAAPGLVVYRFGADLFYANSNAFAADVRTLAALDGVHTVCVDCAAVADVDYSGAATLRELHDELSETHVSLVLADLAGPVLTKLTHDGTISALGEGSVADSVTGVVRAVNPT